MGLLRFLEQYKPDGGETDLAKVVGQFLPRTKRSGLAVFVSDMFDRNGYRKGLDFLRHHRFEPGIVQIHNDQEAEPPLRGDFRMTDIEDNSVRNITVDETALRRYKEKFNGFLNDLKKYCNGNGLACTVSRTSVPFDELILRMMREAGGIGV
jgi:hypothetical protein